jgi:uncharacterized protein YwqG
MEDLPGMTPEQLRMRLSDAGLDTYADALVSLARPSVRLRSSPPSGELQPGTSTVGGEPDLPQAVEWPEFGDIPQAFIAQVNLADIAGFDLGDGLPTSGLLSFFYDSEQGVWGYDPADRGAWAVLYSPPEVPLSRRPIPSGVPDHARYARRGLRIEADITYAPWESSDVESLGLTREEGLAYADVLDYTDRPPIHRLLGHPQPIQGDMQLECQLASNGLYCGDSSSYTDPRADDLRPGALDWRLLLQIDSDDDAGMMWGDVGMIYYWMRKEDLAARAWDASWLVLQCA